MLENILDIPFPHKGLAVAGAIEAQPEGTTAACLNVVGYDPRYGRDRGGQRAGLSKFCTSQIVGTYPLQEITKAVATSIAPGGITKVSQVQGVVAYSGLNSPSLVRFNTIDHLHPTTAGTGTDLGCCWDQSNNLYVASTDGANVSIKAFKVAGLANGDIQATALWTSANLSPKNTSFPVGMAYGGGFVWASMCDTGNNNTYLWKINPADGSIVTGTYVYTSTKKATSECDDYVEYCAGYVAIGHQSGYVEIYKVSDGTVNTIQLHAAGPGDVPSISTDGSKFFVCSFPPSDVNAYVDAVTTGGSVSWTYTATSVSPSQGTYACYDPVSGNVVVGLNKGLNPGNETIVRLDASAGTVVSKKISPLTPTGVVGIGPDYQGGFYLNNLLTHGHLDSGLALTWSDGVSGMGSAAVSHANPGLVSEATGGLSPRFLRPLAVSVGNIRKFNRTTVTQITGGEGALSALAPVVFASQMLQHVVFVDGVSYKKYDILTDTVSALVASQGSLPVDSSGNTCRLVCVWRNCLVLSGLPLDPYNWFMSALRDDTNWNYNPSPSLESQAVAGNNVSSSTPIGEAPDVITALCPYSDEILLFGGDHSIHQMTGHPAAGGRIDLVTDAIGMAWGRPFCRDGQGRLYFFSNRGTIYQFVPGGVPEPISANIAELLYNVDVGQYIVRMAWQERWRSFLVWLTPINSTTPTQHYLYDTDTRAWWPFSYANTSHDPLCVLEMDGDTVDDRVILIGCKDGYVREIDIEAKDDDGTAINSYVRIGPVKSGTALYAADLQCVLDEFSDPVNYAIYKGAYAQQALSDTKPRVGTFIAGRNRSQSVRVFGHALYIQLASRQLVDEAWQLEYMKARVRVPEGKARERVF